LTRSVRLRRQIASDLIIAQLDNKLESSSPTE
jgi:hypothetical protein